MKIELQQIAIHDVAKEYKENLKSGIRAFGGKLDVRPHYQRDFTYSDKQRDAVIETVLLGHPLGVMYWAKRPDGTFEVVDGQQRIVSLCKYATDSFSYLTMYFSNLPHEQKESFLNYKLMIYVCEGSESEKLQWFRTINMHTEKIAE